MPKYAVNGSVLIPVAYVVEADSEDEAYDQFSMRALSDHPEGVSVDVDE